MKLESIHQEPMIDTNRVITRAVVNEVESHCILARQAKDAIAQLRLRRRQIIGR
ncbi:MAG: hypothetical protein QNJ46_14295 [Leptolyngbyaceae cyanobacterium MO_188.B28]|nr:hypothetical protein [Leptolyngbyaceae cyanobacterium MO_188.B28]